MIDSRAPGGYTAGVGGRVSMIELEALAEGGVDPGTVPDLKTRPYQDIGVMFSLQKNPCSSALICVHLCK